MPNDRDWQKRTDDWVKASHESRKRKERARREAATLRYHPPPGSQVQKTGDSESGGQKSVKEDSWDRTKSAYR